MIYILDNDPKLTAQYLDDKSFDEMIKDIAQVLCGVHYFLGKRIEEMPMSPHNNQSLIKWGDWARECKANYLYLVELGLECINEKATRFGITNPGFGNLVLNDGIRADYKLTRYDKAILWARENVPDLSARCFPCGDTYFEPGLI